MKHMVWVRNELRLEDNPLWHVASQNGSVVLPIFIYGDSERVLGSASKWWLHYSLNAFKMDLNRLGGDLLILCGKPETLLPELVRRYEVDAVFWSKSYDPEGQLMEQRLESALNNQGTKCRIFSNVNSLLNLTEISNKAGMPFKVFTPFYKHASAFCLDKTYPAPSTIHFLNHEEKAYTPDDLHLLPTIDWAQGIREMWQPGEKGASLRLKKFLDRTILDYAQTRDFPAVEGTSKLSPHLHFGEISPRTIYRAVVEYCGEQKQNKVCEPFLRQLYWREFAHYLLLHFPHMVQKPMYQEYESFPWRNDPKHLRAWQRGETGYPIIDAGMRELWTTGWMHNRVRMIVGSFLVKDLLLPWQHGAAWFWDTLVDADVANNTLGWQWVAGCGPDAAPYFRIFNPILQSKKFDPDGVYITRWLPEIRHLKGEVLYAPWTDSDALKTCKDYPSPIVDHFAVRERALLAYQTVVERKRN